MSSEPKMPGMLRRIPVFGITGRIVIDISDDYNML